jgi:hypothetical protein
MKSIFIKVIFLSGAIVVTTMRPAYSGIRRYLRVHNNSSESVTVYVDNSSIGSVAAGGSMNYYVGHDGEALTVLDAESSSGATWHRAVPEDRNDFDWYIY